MADPCAKCRKQPALAFLMPRVNHRVAGFRLEAHDLGDAVDLFAAESYTESSLPGDSAVLDVEHARVLRDWLTTWLDRQVGPMQ